MTSPDTRARTAVRLALRAFGHGLPAAAWLAGPNAQLNGIAPLLLAARSDEGLHAVEVLLEAYPWRSGSREGLPLTSKAQA